MSNTHSTYVGKYQVISFTINWILLCFNYNIGIYILEPALARVQALRGLKVNFDSFLTFRPHYGHIGSFSDSFFRQDFVIFTPTRRTIQINKIVCYLA